ncbi:MAG TPA: DUF4426 domain-containing protein [Rudaea sp.]|jgi:hypothetical protein|nr:DUF4426 domain-containing protein [Rudaea sp.]
MKRFPVFLLAFVSVISFAEDRVFGDVTIHANALSTMQLLPAMAKQYGIARDAKRGLFNVSIELSGHTVSASVSVQVGDLTGHAHPLPMRETAENGDVDYLGEFPIESSGTYVFTVTATLPGKSQPFTARFTQDLVVD